MRLVAMNNEHDPRNPILPSDEDVIIMFTDGSSKAMQTDSPYGGWGCLLKHKGVSKELYGGQDLTTNNRMEMMAIIKGLEAINVDYGCDVNIYSDSAYCIGGITSWIHNWMKNGWVNSKKLLVENQDLWKAMHTLVKHFEYNGLKVSFYKVKGHADIEYNEKADELANKGAEMVLKARIEDESGVQ